MSPGTPAASHAETTAAVVHHLRAKAPGLLAVYLFGSRAAGTQTEASDWDFGVWVDGKLDPVSTWSVASELAEICGAEVDLVDMRSASTVMQYQIIVHGVRLWQRDGSVELLEAMVLSEKTNLDEARAPLMQDILARGKVHE